MKRIFTYVTMLTLALACTELYGPEETPLTPDKAGSVEISFSDVTDNSFKVTVTPSGESSYYAYLVDKADAAEELDPATLYAVGYKSVAQGNVKWADASSYTFEVAAEPNTTYFVYAVTGSPMGNPGEIAVKSVKTTDTVAPAYASYSTEENKVIFTFSENVTRGTGDIKVTYYAYYSPEFKQQATPAGEIVVPEEAIQVDANQTLITVPGLPTGCYWTISIPEGAYIDAVGQKLPAYASSFVITEEGKVAPKGFYGEVTYVELPMIGALEMEAFSDWTQPFIIPIESEYPVADLSSKNFITVTYETSTDSSVKTSVFTLAPGETYAIINNALVVMLPEQPAIGADVTISVPAGCCYDIFGNDCEAWEKTLLHSFGYTLDDVIGTYALSEFSAFYGEMYTTSLVIEASDNPEAGNIMFTVYDDFECTEAPIYATFDVDAGTITVPSQQVFGVREKDGAKFYLCFVSCTVNSAGQVGVGSDPVIFNLEAPHQIVGPNYYYGVLYLDESGKPVSFYDVYDETYAELAEAAATSTTSVRHSSVSLDNAVVSRR